MNNETPKTVEKTVEKAPISRKGEIGKRNLRPWKPGQSGNIQGRPKGRKNFDTIFTEACIEISEALKLGREPDRVSKEIVKREIKKALQGDFPCIKDFLDRRFGQAKQPIEEEFSINVNFKKKDED